MTERLCDILNMKYYRFVVAAAYLNPFFVEPDQAGIIPSLTF